MNQHEASVFLEEMHTVGDDWSLSDAAAYYAALDLQEALAERFALLRSFRSVLAPCD